MFKVLMVGLWLAGFFATGEAKATLWTMPAGFAVGTIVVELWSQYQRSKDKPIKIFDSRSDEVPPEVKQKMQEVLQMMIDAGKIPPPGERKKCDNPHCPDCWGLGDNV